MTASQPEIPPLISALLKADAYDHPTRDIRLVETHISWVLLTGDYAYKLKKPVNLGFLDFSTLKKRHYYCDEELRLNRRLAPDIYLDVVAIGGTAEHPVLGSKHDVIEFAVRMKQFSPNEQLDVLLERGELEPACLDAVAQLVADFHRQVAVAGPDTAYGEPEPVCEAVRENVQQIRASLQQDAPATALEQLEARVDADCDRLQTVFRQRKAGGFVRECHGDMHLRNLAWHEGRPLVFDCIEFNPQLRWIDVISEIAFLVMDLEDRGRPQLAWRFLNTWLEHSGDYAGTRVLGFYLLYRALVRAKVEAIRATQAGIGDTERAAVMQEFHGYLDLATAYTATAAPLLMITRGASASGKSTLTQPLLETLGAIRIRSDVERKRLFDVASTTAMPAGVDEGIYSAAASRQTYDRLADLARQVLTNGYPVIVDAVCQREEQVALFRALASELQLPFTILEFTAPADVLRERIEQREQGVSDADRAVLEHQLSTWQPLSGEDQAHCIEIDTTSGPDVEALASQIRELADRGR